MSTERELGNFAKTTRPRKKLRGRSARNDVVRASSVDLSSGNRSHSAAILAEAWDNYDATPNTTFYVRQTS
jgi:hypothetical protein